MLSHQDKTSLLKKEFADMDVPLDHPISKDELFNYLDFKVDFRIIPTFWKAHSTFDRGIAMQLFEHMPKDHNNYITINNFIQTFIDAEEILKQKVENSK